MLRKTEGKRRRGRQRMRYHHRLIGHEFEQTPGDSEGQGSLAWWSSWGCKELDVTEWLNNNKLIMSLGEIQILELLMKMKKDVCEPNFSKDTSTHTHLICPYFIYLFNATYVPSFVVDSGEPVENKTSKSPIVHGAKNNWKPGIGQTLISEVVIRTPERNKTEQGIRGWKNELF